MVAIVPPGEVGPSQRLGGEAAERLGTDPIPVGPYVSAEYFDLETERVFRRSWLTVGRVESLREAGSYFVQRLPNLRTSILVTRDPQGRIHAFHNTCTHRGNRLVGDCAGVAKRLMCGYHGWVFDLEGALRGVPDQAQFPGLKRDQLGLKRVACEVWNGFVMVNLAAEPETLRSWLGELFSAFDDYPFTEMEHATTISCDVRANWKVCMDIGAEAYHVRFVHNASAPDSHVSDDNPLGHLSQVTLYERHRSTSLAANPGHRLRPAEALVAQHAPTVMQAGGIDIPAALNRGKTENWGFDTHIFIPNFGLLMSNGWYVTHAYWPISVNETRWETSLYTSPARTAGARLSQEFSAVQTRDLIREDWAQVERVQTGLESGAIDRIQLSNQEIMVRHSAAVIDRMVRGAGVGGAPARDRPGR